MLKLTRPIIYSPRRYGTLVKFIQSEGSKAGPRGMQTIEVVDAHLIVRQVRDRLVFDPARRMNIGFAIADWLQMMVGDDDADFLIHFASGISEFVDPDDKSKIGGAYGPRIKQPEFSQVEGVINRLKKDNDSRQAVLTIYDGRTDLQGVDHIVPCTLSLQFLIRGGKLHLIASMRSNDIVWGLTYDVFNFTMIQEYVAAKLGIETGDYRHHAGSLHLYVDRDAELTRKLDKAPRVNMKMPPMPEDINVGQIFHCFKEARDLSSRSFWAEIDKLNTSYERDLALVARFWSARKAKEFYEAKAAYDATQGEAIRKMLRFWPIR